MRQQHDVVHCQQFLGYVRLRGEYIKASGQNLPLAQSRN